MIHRILEACRLAATCDYYCKTGGLKKFWDGYDNEPVAWIDDPVSMTEHDEDSIQHLKNVFSTRNISIEIKYGSLVFDSSLVIIASNIDPTLLSKSCGTECSEPIYRRLTDTCGAYNVRKRKHVEGLELYVVDCIKKCVGSDIDAQKQLSACPPIVEIEFDKSLIPM